MTKTLDTSIIEHCGEQEDAAKKLLWDIVYRKLNPIKFHITNFILTAFTFNKCVL